MMKMIVLRLTALIVGCSSQAIDLVKAPKSDKANTAVVSSFIALKKVSDFKGLYTILQKEITDEENKPIKFDKNTVILQVFSKSRPNQNLLVFHFTNLKDAEIGGLYCGSGGCQVLVFLEEAGKYKKVLSETLFELEAGVEVTSQTPDLVFLCHGSNFKRTGYEYGHCQYKYNTKTKQYELQKKEIKDLKAIKGVIL